ncbi:NAD-binding protein [Pararhizobium antarcticum]|uniref:NAD(P)-binding domain-containing protein n=1 Tax=Pararhizobium antarcticum TaxID=1798805 RepID=A0A657LXE9_9HYPH|nr:NAD(P)H-binding protein [Pararhizobium antarcticum]OJG00634.1 hypothetical protein AX760_25370 [Pararhizobium antarcticum]
MYVILCGTGQVGSATARALLDEGQQVTIIIRDESHGEDLKEAGAKIAVADVVTSSAVDARCRKERAGKDHNHAPPSHKKSE